MGLILVAWICSGTCNSIIAGADRAGVWGPNAFRMEIRCGRCRHCSSCLDSFHRPLDAMPVGRPTNWPLHGWRFCREVSGKFKGASGT